MAENKKHKLNSAWTLWYDGHTTSKKNEQKWGDSLRAVVTFDTIEDFWGTVSNIKPASELTNGANYWFFRHGVQPAWEDPANKDGGRWSIIFPKTFDRAKFDEYWLNTIMALIGEVFDNSLEVTGAVVSQRKKEDRLHIWIKGTGKEVAESIGKQWKTVLAHPEDQKIGFQSHYAESKNDMYSV